MEQLQLGTDPYKLHHANASDTEVEAAYRVDTKGDEEAVFRLIDTSVNGLTIKEAARLMGKESNAVSGRFTSLKNKGLIYRTDIRRENSGVMKVTKGEL